MYFLHQGHVVMLTMVQMGWHISGISSLIEFFLLFYAFFFLVVLERPILSVL